MKLSKFLARIGDGLPNTVVSRVSCGGPGFLQGLKMCVYLAPASPPPSSSPQLLHVRLIPIVSC